MRWMLQQMGGEMPTSITERHTGHSRNIMRHKGSVLPIDIFTEQPGHIANFMHRLRKQIFTIHLTKAFITHKQNSECILA